jgi:hypothetical protein
MMEKLAKPFEKPEELILRAIVALAENNGGTPSAAQLQALDHPQSKGKIMQSGNNEDITDQELDELITECLKETGGSAEKQYVERWIEKRLGNRLTPHDWEWLTNEVRWKKRVQFRRLELRKGGVIKGVRTRGVWELASS